jgi:hypothetical protein
VTLGQNSTFYEGLLGTSGTFYERYGTITPKHSVHAYAFSPCLPHIFKGLNDEHRRVGLGSSVEREKVPSAEHSGVDVAGVMGTLLLSFEEDGWFWPFRRAAKDVICACPAVYKISLLY